MAGRRAHPEAIDSDAAEWGVAGMAMPGNKVSGDLQVVAPRPGGMLAGLIDGLGHGSEAAEAARIAGAMIRARSAEPVDRIILACHDALRTTRGAVMALASLDGGECSMEWLCVGNISGQFIGSASGARERLLDRGGVVGFKLPALRPRKLPLGAGDLLIFMSDGVRDDLSEVELGASPQRIADDILRRGARGNDDALVLVVRWMGRRPPKS